MYCVGPTLQPSDRKEYGEDEMSIQSRLGTLLERGVSLVGSF